MVKFNKKGLMVKFLTTLILALVIFVPACMMVSKLFFRLSDQAKDNYLDLTKKLQDFAGGNGEPKSFLLITDGETGIFLFNQKEKIAAFNWTNVPEKARGAGEKVEIYVNTMSFPGQCSVAPCLCLCRSLKNLASDPTARAKSKFISSRKVENDITEAVYEVEIQCEDFQCRQLDGKFLPWSYYREEKGERRTILKFSKENEMVKIANG